MFPHIIIEGPDGAGKTSLAKWWAQKHQMRLHHEGVPPGGTESLLHHYAGLLANAPGPTIFDRLHLGELVYGPLLRGRSRISANADFGITACSDLKLMNRLVKGTGTRTVLCLPPLANCLQNIRGRKELLPDDASHRKAYGLWAGLPVLHEFANLEVFDYTQARFLGWQPPRYPRHPRGVIGSPTAKFLFVGEKANSDVLDLPFFGNTPGRSSEYLNRAIEVAGFDEDEIAFTNALELSGEPRDLCALDYPGLQVVICLGKVAHKQVVKQSAFPFARVYDVPHPSYWKRFKFGYFPDYVNKLMRARHVAPSVD